MRRKLLREDHPATAHSLIALGNLLTDTDRAAEAEPLLRQALEILRNALSEEHPMIAFGKSSLGHCLSLKGQFENAEPLLDESHTILNAAHTTRHTRTRQTLQRTIDLYESWGKPEKAAECRAMLSDRVMGNRYTNP
jgi:hypothetical protein